MPTLKALFSNNHSSVSRIVLRAALAFVIAAGGLLAGCAGNTDDETVSWSQNKLYTEAKDAMEIGRAHV